MLVATTPDGWVVPLTVRADPHRADINAAPLASEEPEKPVFWGCWYLSGSALVNHGGTGGFDQLTVLPPNMCTHLVQSLLALHHPSRCQM